MITVVAVKSVLFPNSLEELKRQKSKPKSAVVVLKKLKNVNKSLKPSCVSTILNKNTLKQVN